MKKLLTYAKKVAEIPIVLAALVMLMPFILLPGTHSRNDLGQPT